MGDAQEILISPEELTHVSSLADNSPSEWRGLPAFERSTRPFSLRLSFDSERERDELVRQLGVTIAKKTRETWSAWWPPREREDLAALRFDFGDK